MESVGKCWKMVENMLENAGKCWKMMLAITAHGHGLSSCSGVRRDGKSERKKNEARFSTKLQKGEILCLRNP